MRKAMFGHFIGTATLALTSIFGTGNVLGYVIYDATPGAIVTLTETPPASGTYQFSEEYLWRDEAPGNPHTQAELGSWASRTKDYRGYQYDGVGNTVLLEDATMYIEYEFIIPVDDSQLGIVTLDTSMNGSSVRARALDYTNSSWYTLPQITEGGAGFTSDTGIIPAAALDTSVNGQVRVQLWVVQEGSGGIHGIDSLTLTATTIPVPEPASLALVGILGLVSMRRR
jgi:hypothetical protein